MPNKDHKTHLQNMAARYAGLKAKGWCPGCGKRRPKKSRVKCPVCLDRALSYWRRNKRAISKASAESNAKLKDEVFSAYGKECACCGECRIEFLTIDHVNGDGAAHRKLIGQSTRHIYLWLKKNGFPKHGFRTLCMNCNFSRGVHGYCPHEREKHHDHEQVRRSSGQREGKRK